MNKTLYFTAPNVPHFIELSNNSDEQKTLKLYFTGSNLNIFKVENVECGTYNSIDTAYNFTLSKLSSIYLEILPNCSDRDVETYIEATVYDSSTNTVYQTYRLVLSLRSDIVTKSIEDYTNLEKAFTHLQKNEIDTFSLKETNPLLTGNVKLQVNSKNEIYISLFENISTNVDTQLYNNRVVSNSDYAREVSKLFSKISNDHDIFYSKYTKDPGNKLTIFPPHFQEINDVYKAGIQINDSNYREEYYRAFAPLYIENKIPSKYVIFRKEKVNGLKNSELLKDVTIVKAFDLTQSSEIGKLLYNTVNLNNFNKSHVESKISNNNLYLDATGIELGAYSINSVFESIQRFIDDESTQYSFEKNVTEIYKRRSMVSHKIINLEFYFNDETAIENKFYSYFGAYVDNLDLEQFDLDFSHNEYQNLFLDCSLDLSKYSNTLYTTSSNPVSSKYVNTGDRLFYIKSNTDFYNIKSIIKNNSKNTYLLDSNINLCNVVNQCKSINLLKENEISFAKSLIKLNFSSLSDLYININKEYLINISTQLDSLQELSRYKQNNRKIKIELEYYTLYDVEYVKIPEAYKLHDLYEFKFYDEDGVLLRTVQSAYSFVNGNNTYVKFSDSIDFENVQYIEFEIDEIEVINIDLSTIADSTEYLSALVSKLNSMKLKYTFDYDGNDLYIYSMKYFTCTVYSDASLEIKCFDNVVEFDRLTISNQDYYVKYIDLKSTASLSRNEILLKLPLLEDFNYSYLNNNKVESIEILTDGSYAIKYKDFTNIVRINKNQLERFMFIPCKLHMGIFSFYDVKEFDFNYFSSSNYHIDQEYNKLLKHFNENDLLVDRMIYSAQNIDSANPIQIRLEYSVSGKHKYNEVRIINIPPSSTVDFSTFVTDYNIIITDKIDFKYRIVSGSQYQLKVYNKFLYSDSEVEEFTPEFVYTPFLEKSIIDKTITDIENKELGWFNYKAESEYIRLHDLSNSTIKIENILNPTVLKWSSRNIKNSRNEYSRLEYSPSFGRTGWNSSYSEYESISDLHSNEWFIINQYPNELNLTNGSERLYNFIDVDEDLLLSETHDYFLEYFENGWPDIKKKQSNAPLPISENWSKLSKIDLNKYGTSFKGVKYKFSSSEDLSDYKFSVSYSTRPPKQNSLALIEHCSVENVDYSCKRSGILPQLSFALNSLGYKDTSKSLKISVINLDTVVNLPRVKSLAKSPTGTLFTSSDFYNEIKIATDLWKNTFNQTYSKSNGWNYDFSLFINRESELFNYPASVNAISEQDKSDYNIGDIRIGFADLGKTDIARTYFIDYDDLYSESVKVPTIILNSRVYFRKNSDTASTDAYSLAYVIAHELGHVFGLSHILNIGALMNPVVKQTYSLSSNHFGNTLKSCVSYIYGDAPLPEVLPPDDIICTSTRNRQKDSFKFIVNKRYKTITLLMYVNSPSYLSFDSKKTYLDFYTNPNLKRIVNVNGTYLLEGIDIEVPEIDLSVDSIKKYNNTIDVTNNYSNNIDYVNLGNVPSSYSYRLSDTINNYYIDHYSLDLSISKYELTYSYDAEGTKNKPLLISIKNNGTNLTDTYLPISTSSKLKSSYFYKLRGGNSILTGNYKSTLDYLEENKNLFEHVYSDESVDKIFDMEIEPLVNLQLKNLKTLEYSNDNSSIYYVNLKSTNSSSTISRYLGEFDPHTRKITQYGRREDLELSSLLGIDLYRLNTKYLYENQLTGVYEENKRKMSFENIKGLDNYEETMFTNFDKHKINYIKSTNTLLNTFDVVFDIFTDLYDFKRVSGFYDPYLYKNVHNSVGLKLNKNLTYKLKETDLTFVSENNVLTIEVNYNKLLVTILKEMLLDNYGNIYNSNTVNLENSLEKFILNNFKYYYDYQIKLYSTKSRETKYNIDITDNDSYFNIINDNITIQKVLDNTIEFSIEITLSKK